MRFTGNYASFFSRKPRTIERFVDPSSSWNPFRRRDGSDWKHCYRSLAAWEAGETRDLVAEKDCAVVNCRSFGKPDTKPVVIEGWECPVTIRANGTKFYNCVIL